MSKFQFVILGIFILFIIVGVAAFATYKGSNTTAQISAITMWGTFPQDVLNQYIGQINTTQPQPLVVKYTQISSDQFAHDFISALARGQAPDAVLIPAELIFPQQDKLTLIPYTALSQRTFLDTYIQEAQIYLTSAGILAMPFSVDPLIMYWNKDQFDAAGIATYPRYWDEFTNLNQKLTLKDKNGNVRRSAIAMGAFNNVSNARELLGSLFLQLGNPVTSRTTGGTVVSTIKSSAQADPSSALRFFVKFSDPSDADYSWNRTLPSSKSAFLSGTLSTYFGFSSEINDIRTKNPNLNFDAAPLPQVRTSDIKALYGRMYGISIVRTSPNANAVLQTASLLTASRYLPLLSKATYLPAVRRDLIAQDSTDPYISVFNTAALSARTWLDSDPAQSRTIFSDMVDGIMSGRKTYTEAINDAGDAYDASLRQALQ